MGPQNGSGHEQRPFYTGLPSTKHSVQITASTPGASQEQGPARSSLRRGKRRAESSELACLPLTPPPGPQSLARSTGASLYFRSTRPLPVSKSYWCLLLATSSHPFLSVPRSERLATSSSPAELLSPPSLATPTLTRPAPPHPAAWPTPQISAPGTSMTWPWAGHHARVAGWGCRCMCHPTPLACVCFRLPGAGTSLPLC